MPKIRVTAIPRKPIDTRGLVATLVDMSKRLAKERTDDASDEMKKAGKRA